MTQSYSETAIEKPAAARPLKYKIWDFENIELFALLGIAFFSVYFLPIAAAKYIFLIFLPLAFRSKRDYLWLAWFFIMIEAPGRLFSASGLHDIRIPIYTLTAGISFEFQEFFLVMYLLKTFQEGGKLNFVFKQPFKYFFGVMVVVLIMSFFLGLKIKTGITAMRMLFPWLWVLVMPFFLDSPEKVLRFSKLVFPIVFIVLALQIHSFMVGDYLDNILRGAQGELDLKVDDEHEAFRSFSSTFLLLLCLAQALFYLASKQKSFNHTYYLAGVIFCAFISMFLSATRGYILGFGTLIFLSLFLMIKSGNATRLINISLISLALVFALQWSFPFIGRQVNAAFERLSTLQQLVSGDVTAGGTLKRLDVRSARVMQQFRESPIIGWGFSDTYFEYADGHVGLQTILLNVGVAGFIFLHALFLHLGLTVWKNSLRTDIKAKWGKALNVYLFALMCILMVHGSSTQFWGYIMHFEQTEKVVTWALLLAFINAVILAPASADARGEAPADSPVRREVDALQKTA